MDELGDFKRYKIGEAAKLIGVKPYVLRFWETEFPELDPVRTSSGQRLYTEEHLALVRDIKRLLYDEGLTIEGARKRLVEAEAGQDGAALLHEIQDELEAILALLGDRKADGGGV